MDKDRADTKIVVVTPRGVAHILALDEYLVFVTVRKTVRGFSIRKVDNISRPIKVDEKIMGKIKEIENSVRSKGGRSERL